MSTNNQYCVHIPNFTIKNMLWEHRKITGGKILLLP